MFLTNGKPVAPVTVNAENAQVIICDERRRAELIEQRQRLLEQEAKPTPGHKVEAAVPAALPEPETQPDPVFQRFQSIGKAESWKGGQDTDPADPIRADAFPEYDI